MPAPRTRPRNGTTAKQLVGRTITAIDFGRFADGRGGVAYEPRITLDNGRQIYFVVQETDVGEYGVAVCITQSEAPAR